MATDKEVEKAQQEVAALREKLAETRAVAVDPEKNNDITMEMLGRESEDLQRQIDEAQAVAKFRHPDGDNPIAFAEALFKRDEDAAMEESLGVNKAAAADKKTDNKSTESGKDGK